MTSVHQYHRSWTLGIAIVLAAMAIAGDGRGEGSRLAYLREYRRLQLSLARLPKLGFRA